MYIDTHCHLNSEQLYNNYEEIIKECLNKNIRLLIIPSYTIESAKQAIEIAEKYDFVYAAIGFHPTEIKEYNDNEYKWLDVNLNHPKVIAVGEIGLDYHWDTTTKEEQLASFKKQIELAIKHNKPVIIHSRDAIQDTYDCLKNNKADLIGGIMHSYAGSVEMAKEFIKLNFLLSFGGPLTFLNAKMPKEVVNSIDVKYLLTETDSPYLAPHPYRGTMNVPMNVILVAEKMANLKNISVDELNKQILENVNRLFKLEVKDEK